MYKRKSSDLEDSGDDDSEEREVGKLPRLEESLEDESDDDDDLEAGNDDKLEEDVGDNEDDLDDSESEPEKIEVPVKKKSKNFGYDYLKNFGYEVGKGLGKLENGILQPVEAPKQKGKRGLGFQPINLKEAIKKYEPNEEEEICFDEKVVWLVNNHPDTVDASTLDSWVLRGPPKAGITPDSPFCEYSVIDAILQSKSILDNLAVKEKDCGRRRSNPFESIRNAIFLNRAAMKMANMDAILDWMFTEPRTKTGEPVVGPNELLYFADVCAGPGGFSEYVLYRKKWRAKGFGFTLKNDNDFQLDQFIAGPSETFEPYYGANGDGDIYLPENIISLRDHVMKGTDGKGVHFMMADGGIHIEQNISDQEMICKKLYLCQCLVALFIVRPGGHFVVKMFDLFMEFSVSLVYLLYRCFEEILILKPNTSRPANSERYLVCKWKRRDCDDIANHLFEINKRVPGHNEKREQDILSFVPLEVLKNDWKFFDYVHTSNTELGKRQIHALIKMVKFAENTELVDHRQQELKISCLKKWNIPLEARAEPKKFEARSKWMELLGASELCNLDYRSDHDMGKGGGKNNCRVEGSGGKKGDGEMTPAEYFTNNIKNSKNSWNCVVLSEEESNTKVGFYLGLGKTNIHWLSEQNRKWAKVNPEFQFNLPPSTILYGEQIQEFTGTGTSQIKTAAFYIIDGLFLGEEDIRKLPFSERTERCRLFAKALTNKNFAIRVKERYYLGEIQKLWDKLGLRTLKPRKPCLGISVNENTFFKAVGVMFIKDVKGVWSRHLGRKSGKYYLTDMKKSIFESDMKDSESYKEAYASFEECFKEKFLWWWDDGVVVLDEIKSKPDPKKLQKADVMRILEESNP